MKNIKAYLISQRTNALKALERKPDPRDPASGDDSAVLAWCRWGDDEDRRPLAEHLDPWLAANLITLDQVEKISFLCDLIDELVTCEAELSNCQASLRLNERRLEELRMEKAKFDRLKVAITSFMES